MPAKYSKIFLMLLFVSCLKPALGQERYEIITTSRLNVRSQPSVTAQVLGSLGANEQVDVFSITDGWAEIFFNGRHAYISANFIQKKSTEPELYEVTALSRLNIRSRPSAEAPVIGTLNTHDQIEVYHVTGQWAKILYNEKEAYVSTKFIRKIEIVAEPEPEIIEEVKPEPNIIAPTPEEQLVDAAIRTSLSDKIGIDFAPIVYGGYSTFVVDGVTPKPTIGVGVDAAFQFLVKDKIEFIPKGYYMEASLGYSLRGSSAFPMHYINCKLLPFGYRHTLPNDCTVYGKLGTYIGYTSSSINTHYNSFASNIDVGALVHIGVEYCNIGLGISYDRGFTKVCDSNLALYNKGIFLNLSYRLLHLK